MLKPSMHKKWEHQIEILRNKKFPLMKKLYLVSESAIETLANKIKDKGSEDQSKKNIREEHQK